MNSLIRKYKVFLNLASAARHSEKTVIYTHQLRVRHLQLFSSNVDDENKNNQFPKTVIESTSIAELLNSSCGFPPEEAKALESRLLASTVKNKKNKKKPQDIENARNVIEFFSEAGFSNTHIRKVISSKPAVLNCMVEETLKPKIKAFEDLGLSAPEIRDFIVSNAFHLNRKTAKLIAFFSIAFGRNGDVYGKKLEPQISKYLEHGISKERLARYVIKHPNLLLMKPQMIEERIQKAYQFGFKYGDGALMLAVKVLCSMNETTWKSKFQVLRSYGWKDDDIVMAFCKAPTFLTRSVGRIKRTLKFFMEDLKYAPFDLASCSSVLTLSFDKRIIPRYNIIKELESKGLMKRKQSLLTIFRVTEKQFQKDFLLDVKDEHPELFISYLKSVQQA